MGNQCYCAGDQNFSPEDTVTDSQNYDHTMDQLNKRNKKDLNMSS